MLVLPSKGASIILANERMINDSLMELACTSNDSVRDPLTNILEEIADLRFGEPPYARPAGFYSGPLYFDVFILDPIGNVTDRMNRLKRQVSIRWCDPIKLSNALRTFHCDYAYGCEALKMDRQAIDELLDIYAAEDAMNPLYLAIDTPDTDTARRIIDDVGDLIGVKIGLTYWYANGPATVSDTVEGFDWFFDGKIYDIPMQVDGAVRSLTRLKPTFISLHMGILKPNPSEEESQREDSMLKAARDAAQDEADRLGVTRPKLLAVTVLTHLPATPTQVVALGHRALLCGVDGLISSPWELQHLRNELGTHPILMTPSIRATGEPVDDQHRTATAWEAMIRGANYIVVGRPITRETNQQTRRDKAKAILDSLP